MILTGVTVRRITSGHLIVSVLTVGEDGACLLHSGYPTQDQAGANLADVFFTCS